MSKSDTAKDTVRPSRSAKLPGLLLKSERIRQNKGRKEVCYGIRVPSYLSKIEHGSVCPDRKILSELFDRLGICYEVDEAKLSCYRKLIEDYFYCLQYELDTKTIYEKLQAEEEKPRYMEEMMMLYYERGIRLLQNTGWQNRLSMLYYNIGATYISLKKYDLALTYLKKAEDHGESSINLLQKKDVALNPQKLPMWIC